jgi:GMP synthase (glutamine-hydrolysing)
MAASRTCLVVGHVAFEDLDLLAPIIKQHGYDVRYLQAGIDPIHVAELGAPELLVVLGGPIGVYEADTYPFIRDEIAAIRARLDADKPMLGICLGAQLMAAALGALVARGPVKEIGWAPVTLTDTGKRSVLATLAETPVLHWHGDNCELPAECERLAFTEHCPVQAFRRRPWQLALQFHLEVDAARFERWLIGHSVELAKAGLDPNELRTQAHSHGAVTAQAGRAVFSSWLQSISTVVA